jgi:large subunit ribosomal protein L31e
LSQELERVDTINLGKVLLSPDNQRSKRAINMIREYARHHMKTEDVRIDEDLAHLVWKRGIKHPPRKVRVRMTKTEEGYVLIAPYEEELETKVTPEEKPTKLEEKAKEKVKPKEEAKEVAAKVEAEVKEVTEKPKKAPAKVTEKPKKAPAKVTEKPKKAPAKVTEKPKAPAKEEKPKKAPAKVTEKPKLAKFVDPEKGAQHYIDRYNKEKKYKDWFHKNYPKYSSIYEAVGLEEPKEKPKAPAKEEKPKKKSS